jgi:amidophosphoribosyltransferase
MITRRIIREWEGDAVSNEVLMRYADPDSAEYARMVEEIRKRLHFTTLAFQRLDDLEEAIGIEPCRLCTYCWSGRE